MYTTLVIPAQAGIYRLPTFHRHSAYPTSRRNTVIRNTVIRNTVIRNTVIPAQAGIYRLPTFHRHSGYPSFQRNIVIHNIVIPAQAGIQGVWTNAGRRNTTAVLCRFGADFGGKLGS